MEQTRLQQAPRHQGLSWPGAMLCPRPSRSFLAIPASSWVDDFIDWLNPFSGCCRVHRYGPDKGKFCPSTDCECLGGGAGGRGERAGGAGGCPDLTPLCPLLLAASLSCALSYCMSMQSGAFRPDVEQFNAFLPWFLSDMPNLKCPKG